MPAMHNEPIIPTHLQEAANKKMSDLNHFNLFQ